MNGLQKIQLGILQEFIRICEILQLNYYLVCGSCLGAVKYKGFIPWDDDVDVALVRDDYEKFLLEAPKLLPDHLFLQNYKSDKQVPFLYSKIRDSRTTFIEKSMEKLKIHHGVYIDVFPLDGYPDKGKRVFEMKKNTYKLQTLCAYESKVKPTTAVFLKAERLLGYHLRTHRTNRRLEKLLKKNSTDRSELWCNFGNWQGQLEYAHKSQYGAGIAAKFEGIEVRIPEKYDEYLTQKYGDWRAELPDDQKAGHHYAAIVDITRPYTEYVKKPANGKIRVKSKEEIGS